MIAAEGILTAKGGVSSHAALVARQMGKVCVCGASASIRPAGSGLGRRWVRSTHTKTIHPAAPSLAASFRKTSKLRVMDLVPIRPTYAATRNRSSSRAGQKNSLCTTFRGRKMS